MVSDDDGSVALSLAGTESASFPLFTSKFSQEEEIILLEEYKQFVETHGHHLRNKWVVFHKNSKLNATYNRKQMAKKIAGFDNKFKKQTMRSSSPPDDPHKARVFQLSTSLWGNGNEASSSPNKKSKLANTWSELQVEELELYHRKLILLQRQCELVLKGLVHAQSSSSKKEQSENAAAESFKGITEDLVAQDCSLNEESFEQQCDESEDEKNLNLENMEAPIDGGISSKQDTHILEDDEIEHEAVDLSLDCVDEKIENQQSCGVPSQVLTHVKVEDDGATKKSSKKKKTKKKKKKERKGTPTPVEAKTQPFSLVIEELGEGDPNGKLASKGAKVKVHISAKVKDSEQPFECTINGSPCIINLDDEEMIEGLRIGIEGMRVGGKRRLIIPPYLGYGDEGCAGVVPPNSWLEYEVELLAVSVRP